MLNNEKNENFYPRLVENILHVSILYSLRAMVSNL